MEKVRGTRTEQNLLAAFAGESQARNRYGFFAKKAKKEGFIAIQSLFEEVAEQERSHAKSFFKLLPGGEREVTASFVSGGIGTTLENLRAAAGGEEFEHSSLYPEFARVAREEGFEVVARLFENIAVAEKHHQARFVGMIELLEQDRMFSREEPVTWICLKCGYIHVGNEAPKGCPACAHPQAYFTTI